MATVSAIAGCSGRISRDTKNKPSEILVAKDATREELIEKFNTQAGGLKSLNATVELRPVAGSKYSSMIQEYHEVKAFLLAERPAKYWKMCSGPIGPPMAPTLPWFVISAA